MKRKSAALALAVVVLSVTAVQAVPTTYQYTGNPFTFARGPYTTNDFVSGMLWLAAPLPPNFIGTVTPTAFRLSDGVQTISNHNATQTTLFQFATDATGAITGWKVFVLVHSEAWIITSTALPFGGSTFDEAEYFFDFGFNEDAPGEWTATPVPDAGSTLSLMTLTFMALGVAARRFKRGAT